MRAPIRCARAAGPLQVDNLLAVAGVLRLDWTLSTSRRRADAAAADPRPHEPPRRRRPLIVVDYAHTDDALEQALASLRGRTRAACVFGCGGERDAASARRWRHRRTPCRRGDRHRRQPARRGRRPHRRRHRPRPGTLRADPANPAVAQASDPPGDREAVGYGPRDIVLNDGNGHEASRPGDRPGVKAPLRRHGRSARSLEWRMTSQVTSDRTWDPSPADAVIGEAGCPSRRATDTRAMAAVSTAPPPALIALKGERFDGHDDLHDAGRNAPGRWRPGLARVGRPRRPQLLGPTPARARRIRRVRKRTATR